MLFSNETKGNERGETISLRTLSHTKEYNYQSLLYVHYCSNRLFGVGMILKGFSNAQ